MRKIAISILLIVTISCRAGTRDELAASLIPDSLLRGANSVIRDYDVTLTIKSPAEAQYTMHKVVTVLNEKAANELSIDLVYNSFMKIGSMTATVYDKNGKLMNKHNKNDMKDYAYLNGFSLYEDIRFKDIRISGGQYPVTIDYTYNIDYDGILDYPDWRIQQPNQSVENASLTVSVPASLDINYKSYNTAISPQLQHKDELKTYTWIVTGAKAISVPGNSYAHTFYLPYVDLSPKKFGIAGYKGSLSTWKDFGSTFSGVYKDKRMLTEQEQSRIKNMVKNAKNDREKAEILYAYLQRDFRYVSIDIGFGGYIPFAAATVDTTKYGDCKALSNYMCAMLDLVGIKAYPTLINAGADQHPIDTTFPSNKFNHCILYAEIDSKPIWLECTNNALPFGELGTFTENRYGLLLTEDGGRIVNTPVANAAINTLHASHTVTLADQSHATIAGAVDLGGEYRIAAKAQFARGAKKEKENYIFSSLHVKQYETSELTPAIDSAGIISFGIKGEIANAFDFNTGNKFFLPATYLKNWYENVNTDSSQGHDLILNFPSTKNERLVYELPDSQKVSLPADFDIDDALISFHRRSKAETKRRVVIETTLVQKKHIIRPEELARLKESLQKINKYIQQKVILEKSAQ